MSQSLTKQFPNEFIASHITGNMSVLYQSENGAIVLPHDFAAMKHLMRDTEWTNEDGTTDYGIDAFERDFNHAHNNRPVIVYLMSENRRKFIYGLSAITNFADEQTCDHFYDSDEVSAVNDLYEEAITHSLPGIAAYIKATAHCLDIAEYDKGLEADVKLDTARLPGKKEAPLTDIGEAVIAGILQQDYLPGDMFGAEVFDPTDPENTRHVFGDKRLQTHIPFLLKADQRLPYNSKPLKYINPDDMTHEEYRDISLMLIAQNPSPNIKHVDNGMFEDMEFVSVLMEIARTTQDANKRSILMHLHKVPQMAFLGISNRNRENLEYAEFNEP